jgi:hypothetical protein
MKIIEIENCWTCPYHNEDKGFKAGVIHCGIVEYLDKEYRNKVHKNCPLEDDKNKNGVKMKTININKVIREIENKKRRLSIYFPEGYTDFAKGVRYACDYVNKIIKENIKEIDNDLLRLKMD